MTYRISVLGDFNPAYLTHHALNDSIRQIKKKFKEEIQFDWISSDMLNFKTTFNNMYCGPALTSTFDEPNPLIVEFVKQALTRK